MRLEAELRSESGAVPAIFVVQRIRVFSYSELREPYGR
jgi:hypothetical protein